VPRAADVYDVCDPFAITRFALNACVGALDRFCGEG